MVGTLARMVVVGGVALTLGLGLGAASGGEALAATGREIIRQAPPARTDDGTYDAVAAPRARTKKQLCAYYKSKMTQYNNEYWDAVQAGNASAAEDAADIYWDYYHAHEAKGC